MREYKGLSKSDLIQLTNASGVILRNEMTVTTISNVLIDSDLSLQAKGLYLIIERTLNKPNFILCKRYIINYHKKANESEHKYLKAWQELLDKGWMKAFKVVNFNGRKGFSWCYELLSTADLTTPCVTMLDNNGKVIHSDNLSPKQIAERERIAFFEEQEFLGVAEEEIYNQNIMDENTDADVRQATVNFKKQINYSALSRKYRGDKNSYSILKIYISVLVEILVSQQEYFNIKKMKVNAETIHKKVMSLSSDDLIKLVKVYYNYNQKSEILNSKAFILATLYRFKKNN